MKLVHKDKKMAGFFLGVALLLVVVTGSAATVSAQYDNRGNNRGGRNWDGYPNWGGSYDLRQTALNAGYNEGTKEGANDRARGRRSNFQDFSAYRNGTKDYSSRLGDRELYRRYYQRAFESGYGTELGVQNNVGYDNGRVRDPYQDNRGGVRRGRNWDQYGTYGGSYQLRQTALNAGYNDGNKQAKNDRSRGRNSDYQRSSAYQNATRDYNSRMSDRELYRRYYREGYENGYADGYAGY